MPRKRKADKPDAPPATTNGAVLSLSFAQRDEALAALLEIELALASLHVLYNYCEEHSLHHTPLLALHGATLAIDRPHARLRQSLDPDTTDAVGANG